MVQRQAKNNRQRTKVKRHKQRNMLEFAKQLREDMKRIFLKTGNIAPAYQLRNERLALLTPEEGRECIEWEATFGDLDNRPNIGI